MLHLTGSYPKNSIFSDFSSDTSITKHLFAKFGNVIIPP